jgi:hypothetical protein
MTDARFRFAADILRRLGEELNPSPDQGIIELVKNAYDADALKCHVELDNVERAGGTVRVTDDGDGMAAGDIVNGWLVLGRSNKVSTSATRRGRRPAGSKGLGRLAALRLGTHAAVATRPRSEPGREYSLSIDWSEFDNVGLVDDVPLVIQNSAAPASARHGTVITLSELRSRISRTDVKKLARGLILLADPFGDDPSGFKPTLEAPEFRDLERLVKNRYFEDADYHLTASLDDDGLAHAVVSDFKGEPLFEAKHEDIARDRAEARYATPALSFDLWVYILNQTSFQLRTTTLGEVRDWLSVFGGVHVYQNGIRVAPYGVPGSLSPIPSRKSELSHTTPWSGWLAGEWTSPFRDAPRSELQVRKPSVERVSRLRARSKKRLHKREPPSSKRWVCTTSRGNVRPHSFAEMCSSTGR